MKTIFGFVGIFFLCCSFSSVQTCLAASGSWDGRAYAENARKVADWMLAHPKTHSPFDWTYGAFYAGLTVYGLSEPSAPYLGMVRALGAEKKYSLEQRLYHADSHCIGQTWLELAMADNRPVAAAFVRRTFDYILSNPNVDPLSKTSSKGAVRMNFERWCWCDALFMAPTVWNRMAAYTGEEKYRDFMDREYRATYEELYDRKEHLFYRDARYIGRTTKNGKKIFWSRGDGWVFGGLPLILRDMPADRPSRTFYVTLFQEMAAALKACQREDGGWSPSLLDPHDPDMQEMSGTSFFCYGMMWGVNRGLLRAEEYLPCVERAWTAMNRNVREDGLFGWVQQIGDRPVSDYTAESTEVYAVGAYLLASVEIRKYAIAHAHPERKTATVSAPSRYRAAETITLDWKALGLSEKNLVVFDTRDGAAVPHQLFDSDGNGEFDQLLFSASLQARCEKEFWIFNGTDLIPASTQAVCFGRYAPERMDDYLWENDRSAYRVYGPGVALPPPQGEGLVSSGIDVWSKKVSYPVINAWLKGGHYHKDSGEGMDHYSVGTTRGCGGFGVWRDGAAYVAGNWATQKNLCNGPVRTSFALTYDSWNCGGGVTVSETRIATLDRGMHFTRFESRFTIRGADRMIGGPGMNISRQKQHQGVLTLRPAAGWLAGFEDECKGMGNIATALVLPGGGKVKMDDLDNLYLVSSVESGKPFVWYAGAAWSGADAFTDDASWSGYVSSFADALANPLRVTVR